MNKPSTSWFVEEPRFQARWACVLLSLTLLGCGDDEQGSNGATCVEGTTQECACAGGQRGIQTCTADSRFDSCLCPDGGGVSGSDAGVDSSSGVDASNPTDAGARDTAPDGPPAGDAGGDDIREDSAVADLSADGDADVPSQDAAEDGGSSADTDVGGDVTAADADVGSDPIVDGPADTSEDGGADTGPDTGSDTLVDSGADTGVDTFMDTGFDTFGEDEDEDTGGGGDECVPPRSGDSFSVESVEADEEWADCISGCAHDVDALTIVDFEAFPHDGLHGRIDDEAHDFSGSDVEVGPDIDLLGLQLPARTMLEVVAEPFAGTDVIEPVIYLHDGFQLLTFGFDALGDQQTARTVVAAPYLGGLPFYLGIEHGDNYDVFGTPDAVYVGGDDYEYVIRFRTWAFDPTDLGTLDGETPTASATDAELSCPGDIHYYRFEAPADSSLTVSLDRTGSEFFLGVLVGLDATGGQLSWEGIASDAIDDPEDDGHTELTDDVLVPDGTEFFFAVTDWEGAASPGEFTYDVTVILDE